MRASASGSSWRGRNHEGPMKDKQPSKTPATDAPEPSPLEKMERMKDFTRRLLAVPKSAIVPPKPKRKRP